MKKVKKFGEHVEGYDIPVLNEREIRAAAGILFLVIFIAFMRIIFKGDFLMVKYVTTVFLIDFILRVFVHPKYSPSLIIGRLMVRNQVPEYVGAQQKQFAWVFGVVLSAIMFIFLVLVNAYSPITGIGCLVCLIFLFFESVFGICLGCKVYSMIFKDKAQYCPGEICDAKARQDIQKISRVQLLILFGLIAFLFFMGLLFNDQFHKQPYDLFGIDHSTKSK